MDAGLTKAMCHPAFETPLVVSERDVRGHYLRATATLVDWKGFLEKMVASLALLTILEFLGATLTVAAAGAAPANSPPVAQAGPKGPYGLLPLSFEPNEGQTDGQVRFLARGQGYTLFLTADEAVLALQKPGQLATPASAATAQRVVVRLKLLGANPRVKLTGEEELPGKSNYFLGNDPGRWHTDLPTYAKVRYAGLYPGVDALYYGREEKLEYDFIVAPGVDPRQVRLRVEGAERVRSNRAGELVLETPAGEVVLRRPEAYQGEGASKRRVAVRYAMRGKAEFGFEVLGYSKGQPLVIDPVLDYSTYLGGSGSDTAYGIVVDSAGNAYVTGVTGSPNFPVQSAFQSTQGGVGNAFVSKLNAAGSGLVYSTYLGGTGPDSGSAIAIDSTGSAYVVGSTSSSNFPVTANAFQTTYGGDGDAFVAKLSPAGSALTYATYLGGTAAELGQGIAVDASGNAYVTGSTQSPDFPTLNPLFVGNEGCTTIVVNSQNVTTCTADAFVTELNPAGTALVYSTYLGGSSASGGQAIAVDASGNAYIAGFTYSTDFPTQNALQSANAGNADCFVTELSPGGTGFVFSTYLGGSGLDQALALALDAAGNIYLTGTTQSPNFPVTANVFQSTYGGNGDAFVTKLAAGGGVLVYSTFIGGSSIDQGNGIAVDSMGNVVVVGFTQSTDFPLVDPLQILMGISGAGTCGTTGTGGEPAVCPNAFITRLGPSAAALYSTFLGGAGANAAQAVALDPSGTPIVAGGTAAPNFPATVGVLQPAYAGVGTSGNAFVARIGSADAPAAALTPQTVNFGNEVLNVTSNPQAVTLVDSGSSPLQIASITASGEYAQTNNCGTNVPAGGGTCTINITFTPTTAGSNTDQVSISDNAAGSPHEITVTGNGVAGGAGTLSLIPAKLIFPTQTIQTTSPAQVVQVVNGSLVAVTISNITVSGDFAETNNCGAVPSSAYTLNPGGSCEVSITFTPTTSGSRTGSLTITDNAATTTQSASLTGIGASPFTLSATSLTSTILIGTTYTTFTISASGPSSFTSTITLSCTNGAKCSFAPSAGILIGQSTTLTVSGLSATTANPDNFSVTGASAGNSVSLALTIFLQDFLLSAAPPLDTINGGQSANYTVTVTPLYGFNQVVLMSCAGTLPPNSSCTWSPPGVVVGSTAPSSIVTLATTTQISTTRGWPRDRSPGGTGWGSRPVGSLWIVVAGMMALLAALLASNRRLPRLIPQRARWMLMVGGLLLLTLTGMSCQNYFYNPITTATPVGTPIGNYVLTLTGALGSNPNVTRSVKVNLAVGPG